MYGQGMDSTAGNSIFEVSSNNNSGGNNNDRDERLRAEALAMQRIQAQTLAAEKLASEKLPDNNITASSGPITPGDLANLDNSGINSTAGFVNPEVNIYGEAGRGTGYVDLTSGDSVVNSTAVETSLVPRSRPADLIDNSETSGIMSVVTDVKNGIKNFIEDVGMTYAGGFGSFSDLTNSDNYDAQYKKLVDAGYSELDVSDYLNTTRAGQIEIRDNTLDIGKTISAEERKAMQDEGSGTQIVDPIITGFEDLNGDSFEGKGVTNLFDTSNATDSNATVVPTVFYDRVGNEHATQADADASNEQIEKALAFSLLSDSEKQFGVGYGDDYVAETITPTEVVPTEIITPTEVVPETITPPVGGNFALPGQQNFGPTPSAALNFNPNTYMQTPLNADVALSAMFEKSDPYTFEELLNMYKPAYPSFG